MLGLIIALVFGFWFLVFGFNRVLLAGCGQAGIKIFSGLYLVVYIKWFILSDLYLMIWMVGEA
ncbi:hypothetical protein NP7_04965 [Moraxella osloensis]|uniref:Uncharacterized protein n=1 Tax=Faucicola osloensis TaxID=34062 RepID=A0A2D2LUH2_FAUOS|nr:hypothetical protein NP7_04965 [Moraxella osloensis]